MSESFLMPNEKVISSRKPSIVGIHKFWIGIVLIILSVAIFLISEIFYTSANFTFQSVLTYMSIISPLPSIVGTLPVLPTIFMVIGFFYMLYAELDVYFIDYIVTTNRVIFKRGVISKDLNIILPAKIGDVTVDLSIVDRLLGIGKIILTLETSAKEVIVLRGIRDPYKFQGDVLKLIGSETYRTGPPAQVPDNGSGKSS